MKTIVKILSLALLAFVLGMEACSDNDPAPDPDPPIHTITSISPTSGTIGTNVTINGTGFSTTAADNIVTFDDEPAQVISASPTQLVAKAPAGGSTGPVAVEIDGVNVTGPTFTYLTGPVITSISPTSGSVGFPVTITGTGFSTLPSQNIVRFGTTEAIVTASSETSLTVTVPNISGTVAISVEVDGITATGPDFTVIGVMVTTLAGDGSAGFADGTGSAAKFKQPQQLVVDPNGNVYVADQNNHKIRKITPAGVVTTLAGSSEGYANGTGAAAQFKYPIGLALNAASGDLFVSEVLGYCIRKVTTAGGVTTHVAGSVEGIAGDADGTGAAARFHQPGGMAMDANGNLYVADTYNHRIRKVTPAGVVTTLAGSTDGFTDGTGAAAKFSFPTTVTVDPQGNVYVGDNQNAAIRKITPAGVVTTVTTNYPYSIFGLAIAADGTIVVASSASIYFVSPTTGEQTKFIGNGPGFTNGGPETAQFNFLTSIAIDAAGNMYVTDYGNHSVRKVTISQ